MFVNLHTLPPGRSLYTVAVTDEPTGTPAADLTYDEVDVVAPARASVASVLAAADLGGYEDCRVVGVVDQSSGYVVAEAWDGDLRCEDEAAL